MLLLRLWNYIRGYVIILVEGYFLEKFINVCIHRQIFLWDIKRQKNSTMILKVSIKGFRMLRPIARKTKCRVRLKSKRGLPFVLNRYKKRKAFVIGAVVFIALFYLLSTFIWAIEITGNEKLETGVILQKLEALGIKPGVMKYRIDPDKIVNDMMLSMEELSWINVVVKGTKVKVEIAERIKPPELIPKNVPCDIVAAKDGVIKSINTRSGQGMVKPGNTVTKGQVLISGTIKNKYDEKSVKLVHSLGTVLARTWYEANSLVEGTVVEKVRTGVVKTNYSLMLFSNKLKFFHGKYDAESYDREETDKKLALGEDLVLPFGIVIEKYYEYKMVERDLSLEGAKKIAEDKAVKQASEQMPDDAEIVKTTSNIVENSDGDLVVNVIIECVEDIGVTKEIGGN